MPDEPESQPAPNQSRIYVAAILALGLIVGVVIVVLAGGGGDEGGTAADPACVDDWNADQTMIAFGQHQFGGHGYDRVQVLRVDENGLPTDSEAGSCAVVFAARALDPEPGARAQILLDGTWTGFESLGKVSEERIETLQADAFAAVNATLSPEGQLVPSAG